MENLCKDRFSAIGAHSAIGAPGMAKDITYRTHNIGWLLFHRDSGSMQREGTCQVQEAACVAGLGVGQHVLGLRSRATTTRLNALSDALQLVPSTDGHKEWLSQPVDVATRYWVLAAYNRHDGL
eukprot:1156588-Amphidinium_carterae.1